MRIPINIASQPFRRDRAMMVASALVALLLAATLSALVLLARGNPGLGLCAGHAFSEQIATVTTYEVREVNPATGAALAFLSAVTGAGFLVQTCTATIASPRCCEPSSAWITQSLAQKPTSGGTPARGGA